MRSPSENNAPLWIRQVADSLIVLAAALSIIGINFAPYFEARERIAILKMEIELEKEKAQIKTNPKINSKIKELEDRLIQVESLSHKPNK